MAHRLGSHAGTLADWGLVLAQPGQQQAPCSLSAAGPATTVTGAHHCVLCTGRAQLLTGVKRRRAGLPCTLAARLHAPPPLTTLPAACRRDYLAKIADVGIARVISSGHMSSMTSHGTFAWAAPELLLGEAVTTQADIYSYGVCLWVSRARNLPVTP